MKKFYFAYGANTHKEHMASRCPAARPVGKIKLFGHRLAFRGVADVVREQGATVHGALWEITAECERALDRFEGYPRLYVKRIVRSKVRGQLVDVMFYVMREKGDRFSVPPRSYERTLREGYGHFGIKVDQIDAAVAHAATFDREPPFVSKWHRIDAGEDVQTSAKLKPGVKARARPTPPSREPAPQAWEQWRFETFDERLRRAKARPLPNPPPGRVIVPASADSSRLLAIPFDRDTTPAPRRGSK